MSDPKSAKAQSGAVFASWLCAAFAVVYLVFPHALILPFMAIYGKSTDVPPAVRDRLGVLMIPIALIGDYFPAYREFIVWESEATGIW